MFKLKQYRWQVVRGYVKHKGTLYFTGDFLPETFTDRDRARHIYSRRMELAEYTPEPTPEPVEEKTKTVSAPTSTPPKAEKEAPKAITSEGPPASPQEPTGTKKKKKK